MTSRPILRAVKKTSMSHIQLPKFDLPPNMTWGASQPPQPGYDRFFSEAIQSVLTLPSTWNTYESELKVKDQVVARFVLSSLEDPLKQGFFNTGATFTLFQNISPQKVESIGETLRQSTLKEVGTEMGGSKNWLKYGEDLLICSLRYSVKMPEIRIGNQQAKSEEMVFIQDITVEKRRGLIFLMKYETPKPYFTKEIEEKFRTIKTGGYYAVHQDPKNSDNDENGFVFLQL